MREHAQKTHSDAAEPLQNARQVIGSAMETVRPGAADAHERITGAMPPFGEFLGRVVYTASYGLSFGIVFPAMLAARSVPMDNALGHGLMDGAAAAASSSRVGATGQPRRQSRTSPHPRRRPPIGGRALRGTMGVRRRRQLGRLASDNRNSSCAGDFARLVTHGENRDASDEVGVAIPMRRLRCGEFDPRSSGLAPGQREP